MERLADCGIYHCVHNVISYKCINNLPHIPHGRHGKQQNGCQCIRDRQSENPDSGLSVFGMGPVNNSSHEHIGKSVKYPGEQHDHTHCACRYAYHVRVEIYQQCCCHRIHQSQRRVTKTVRQLFRHWDFDEFIHIFTLLLKIQQFGNSSLCHTITFYRAELTHPPCSFLSFCDKSCAFLSSHSALGVCTACHFCLSHLLMPCKGHIYRLEIFFYKCLGHFSSFFHVLLMGHSVILRTELFDRAHAVESDLF